MLEGYHRYCDRCGKKLTKENNKCHYEICDMCNNWLETHVKQQKDIEDIGDYPDEILNQFDNMTGSMNL